MVLDNLPRGFTAVSKDESFFFIDSLIRKVSSYEGSRPVVRITGSHQLAFISLWCYQSGWETVFHSNSIIVSTKKDTFYEFLKQIHRKFSKCYLFLDKAPQHYRSSKVRKYIEEHKDSLIPVYLPTASPEFMLLEGCWNISNHE